MKSLHAEPSLWHELRADRVGRLSHALRITLCCVLTCLLVQYYQTPQAALSVYIVFFLVKPDRRSSIVQSIAVVLLMGLIIALLLLIIQQVIDEPVLRLASMAALSLFFMFAAQASKLRPVGAILALILAYTLDLVAQAFIGELATRALLYGWLAAIIPAGICLSIALFFAPSPAQLLRKTLARYLDLAAAQFQAGSLQDTEAWQEVLGNDHKQLQQWLKLSASERNVSDLAQLQRCCHSLGPLLMLLEHYRTNCLTSALPAPYQPAQLAQFLNQFSAALATQQSLPRLPALTEAAARHAELRELAAWFDYISTTDSAELAANTFAQTEIKKEHADQEDSTENAAENVTENADSHLKPHPDSNNTASGFWLADAFTNPEYPRLAVRTSAAALICYVLYSLLDWSGIHTSLITCYIVALASTAETVQKLRLRLIGCLIGSVAGVATILFIMPEINSLTALLLLIALASLASAWVAAGSSRIAYAGLQIAFAYYLCVLQGHGPAFDLVVPRDRVIGILLGLIVVYLIFVQLWPVSLARQIDQRFLHVQNLLLQLVAPDQCRLTQQQRYDLFNQIHCEIVACQTGFNLLNYEPSAVRPADYSLAQSQNLLRCLQQLALQLLLTPTWSFAARSRIHQILVQLAELKSSNTDSNNTVSSCHDQFYTLSQQLQLLLQQHVKSDCLNHETLHTTS